MHSRRNILLLFLLSGASGLIYQVIWARLLGLVFGNTTTSIAVVLAAFMAGLALGAAWAGRSLVRRANPMLWYALLEGAIGAYALAFPLLLRGMESLYPTLFTDTTAIATLTAFRAVSAFALLLVPTTLMGATLPLTTEYVHRMGVGREDWNAGRLYGANTLGAALGSALSGFVLIEWVGIQNTIALAAMLNVFVMGIGLYLARRRPVPAGDALGGERAQGNRALLLLFALSGALALAGEVLWTRALTLLLGSSTYAFSAILIVYLVGIAVGSWSFAGPVRRMAAPSRLLPFAVLGAGAWHVLAVQLVPLLYAFYDFLMAEGAAGSLGLRTLLFGVAVLTVMFPPAFLSGALFPVITRLVGGSDGDQGAPIARAYAWNTVGAIFGSLFAGFVLAPFLLHFHAIYVLALLFFALTIYALWVIGQEERKRLAFGIGSICAVLAALSANELAAPDLFVETAHARRPQLDVLVHESGLQGITTVLAHPRYPDASMTLLVNGMGMTAKVFATKAMAHVPLITHGAAEDTLVVCFGMGTTFRSALSHGGRVDVVELVPGVVNSFETFYPDAARVRSEERGRILVNDGRNFLLMTRKRYDVITIDPPPPIDSAGVNNLYSREFLVLMRDHLKPNGIAAHWIPFLHPANGIADQAMFDSLVATFLDVFPHARMVQASKNLGWHLLGSMEPFEIDSALVQQAIEKPRVKRDFYEYRWDPPNVETLLMEVALDRARYADAPLVTDDRPLLEFNLFRNLANAQAHTLVRVSP